MFYSFLFLFILLFSYYTVRLSHLLVSVTSWYTKRSFHYSINLLFSHAKTYPTPFSLNTLWNFGFILVLLFFIQIISGLLITTAYSTTNSYLSLISILRNAHFGYLLRLFHSSSSSFLLAFLYLHFIRSSIFLSFLYLPNSWFSGLFFLLITFFISFLGYVLPWGLMSFWAATVITSLLFNFATILLCGGLFISVSRFFLLHLSLSFTSILIILSHLFYLHLHGSSNPLGFNSTTSIPFFPTIIAMDLNNFTSFYILAFFQTMFGTLDLTHPDLLSPTSAIITPINIVPEWYFLFFYAILKTIPAKNTGLHLILTLLSLLFYIYSSILSHYASAPTSHCRIIIVLIYLLCSVGSQLPIQRYIGFGRTLLLSLIIISLL